MRAIPPHKKKYNMNINEAMEQSKEILKTLFIENISTLCTLNNDEKNIKCKISAKNSDYVETPYYYNEKKLLHFTSLPNLCEILNSNSLRMYSLNNCNDTLELEYWKKLYDSPDFDFYKNHHILSASFSKPDKYNDFNMWRLYGDKGNGVCIEFEIENEQEGWKNFLLASIQYQKDNTLFDMYFDAIKKFKKKHNYDISLDLSPIIPFFKSSDWAIENEVRMIFYNDAPIEDFKITQLQNIKSQGMVSYIPFPLSHISKHEEFKINDFETVPKLTISKIYTGFDSSDKRYYRLYDLISDYKKYTIEEYGKDIKIVPLGIQGKIR